MQEASTSSSLNHPCVCAIHDIKEEENHQFIVMEYVEGKTFERFDPGEPISSE